MGGPNQRRVKKEQILDAAEQLFADHGLTGTSIREITTRLGSNNAMVYYYFDNKTALYEAVIRRYLGRRSKRRVESIRAFLANTTSAPCLEDLLQHYVRGVLEPQEIEGSTLLVRLLSRELLEPHIAWTAIFKELVEPVEAVLTDALQRCCPGLQPMDARRAIHSVFGQTMHAIYLRRLLKSAESSEATVFDWNDTVTHVVRFSAAGIRALLPAAGSDRQAMSARRSR